MNGKARVKPHWYWIDHEIYVAHYLSSNTPIGWVLARDRGRARDKFENVVYGARRNVGRRSLYIERVDIGYNASDLLYAYRCFRTVLPPREARLSAYRLARPHDVAARQDLLSGRINSFWLNRPYDNYWQVLDPGTGEVKRDAETEAVLNVHVNAIHLTRTGPSRWDLSSAGHINPAQDVWPDVIIVTPSHEDLGEPDLTFEFAGSNLNADPAYATYKHAGTHQEIKLIGSQGG